MATVSMLPQIIMHTENNKAEQTSEVLSQVATYFNDLADFVNESNVIINMMVSITIKSVLGSLGVCNRHSIHSSADICIWI